MSNLITFKDNSERLAAEWADPQLHHNLKEVVAGLALWLGAHGIPLVITCLHRTPEENKADGGQPDSAHITWRAVDIRTWSFTPEIEAAVLALLRGAHPTAMIHAIIHNSGMGKHLHININRGWADTYHA